MYFIHLSLHSSVYSSIQRETILHHLTSFVQAGQSLPVARLQAESTLTNELQRQIFAHFAALGVERLRPIFEAMAEQVSYDELHLLRAIYKLMQVDGALLNARLRV